MAIAWLVVILTVSWWAPYDPLDSVGDRLEPPSWSHWFGTDALSRDVFTRVLYGARQTLPVSVAVIVCAVAAGAALGSIAGYFGGWVDSVIMRVVDVTVAFPPIFLAMAIAAALGPGIPNMVFAISMSWWPGFARLVRGEVMAKKEEVYVQAARAIGAGTTRIIMRHILPNILSPIIVKMSLDMGFAILTVASLGFVGIGVKPPTPEWGSLLSLARGYLPDYWWTAIFPGCAIFLAVFGFNLLGDGLRDVLDPRARR